MKSTFGSGVPFKILAMFVLLGPLGIFARDLMANQDVGSILGLLVFAIIEGLLFRSIFRDVRSKTNSKKPD